ncbi:hypothetical protein M8J76_009994 [Diaphorina citri]|nr:hypothetical protein M8J76_007344 [Diaphorina citri]KAI5730097.1 hypothetical protein M8J76_009994 [Diaphorina citri]
MTVLSRCAGTGDTYHRTMTVPVAVWWDWGHISPHHDGAVAVCWDWGHISPHHDGACRRVVGLGTHITAP